ncbi:MAG: hypothetical protein QOJ99_2359 [Bryobacterales bacterium]|nr:hypothetical protein [Bryobacterales bacterium]
MTSVEEYLRTSYRPDCDYVDGEVLERNLGEIEHSGTQGEIIFYLRSRYPSLRRRVLPEQRVQMRAQRFRVPDVCVLAADAPHEKIVRTPPLLCIEVLSKDDSMGEMMERIDEYFDMGVGACWIIDPLRNRAWCSARRGQMTEPADGVLRAGTIEMPLAEVIS